MKPNSNKLFTILGALLIFVFMSAFTGISPEGNAALQCLLGVLGTIGGLVLVAAVVGMMLQ